MPKFKLNNTILNVADCSIIQAGTEAIVNAANSGLHDGAGVTGAIFGAAGYALGQYTAKLGGCPTGHARLTPGFNLPEPTRYIVHAVGPVFGDQTPLDSVKLLASAYRASMELVTLNNIKSIGFPAVSAGIYGFPLKMATTVALRTIVDFLKTTPNEIEEVKFTLLGDAIVRLYSNILTEILNEGVIENPPKEEIYFFNREDPFYEFSNLGYYGFLLNQFFYKTSEHYFQANKFTDIETYNLVAQAPNVTQVWKVVSENQAKIRPDWETVRQDYMWEAVGYKLAANPFLIKLLDSTGDRPLVYDDREDAFWGTGADGNGQNELGKTLMDIRAEYRKIGEEPGEPAAQTQPIEPGRALAKI